MILLDNCVPHCYRHLLHEWGYEVVFITNHIAADSPDTEVIALAVVSPERYRVRS